MSKEEIAIAPLDDEELLDLESLIRDGIDNRTSISVDLPDGRTGAALIRPLSAQENNQCTNEYMKNKRSIDLSICVKGMLTPQEKPFPQELIEKLPAGVVTDIANEIRRISGIKTDPKEAAKLTKQILGF